MDNKNIFAANLLRYMEMNGKSRREVSDAIGVSYYTFTDWVKGKKYPRMDKVEKLAAYFGILKSDLIEDKADTAAVEEKPTDPRVGELSEDELDIIADLRRLKQADQDAILRMIRSLSGSGEK